MAEKGTYFACLSATCSPDEISSTFLELLKDYAQQFPKVRLLSAQHSTCLAPSGDGIVLTVLITAEER